MSTIQAVIGCKHVKLLGPQMLFASSCQSQVMQKRLSSCSGDCGTLSAECSSWWSVSPCSPTSQSLLLRYQHGQGTYRTSPEQTLKAIATDHWALEKGIMGGEDSTWWPHIPQIAPVKRIVEVPSPQTNQPSITGSSEARIRRARRSTALSPSQSLFK